MTMTIYVRPVYQLPRALGQVVRKAWLDTTISSGPTTPSRCIKIRGFTSGDRSQARHVRAPLFSSRASKPSPPAQQKNARAAPRATSQSQFQARLEHLFKAGDEVLLFQSRENRGFVFWSFLVGGFFIYGGYTTGSLFFRPQREDAPRLGWLVTLPQMASTAFMFTMGIAIFWAPLKTLKSVTAVANRGGPLREARPTVLFEMSQPLPFMPKKTFELAPQDVFIDRRLSAVDLKVHSVPLSAATSFTEQYQDPSTRPTQGIGRRVAAFNQSLIDIWPTTKRTVRQMLLREGFAKIYCRGYGVWKLDMPDSQILDSGRPLELLSTKDENVGQGVLTGGLQKLTDWVRSRG